MLIVDSNIGAQRDELLDELRIAGRTSIVKHRIPNRVLLVDICAILNQFFSATEIPFLAGIFE